MDRTAAVEALRRVVANVESVIIGKRAAVEASVLALAADGHLLIEDAPGVGKTMLARSIARSIDGIFRRIQATPDLLPSDITGVAIFHQGQQQFEFIPGPIFGNVVLVDEVNRTTPRTQSSMLEAMEERQVTAEGTTRPLPAPFFLVATQNPLEYHGTYPLPEGQLDRFLIATTLGYPSQLDEEKIVIDQLLEHPFERIGPVVTLSEIEKVQTCVRQTRVEPIVIKYAVELVSATRTHEDVMLGAGPRASVGLVRVAQARALLRGSDYVLPDDVKAVASIVMGHRIVMKPQLRLGHQAGRKLVGDILARTPVPVSG